MVLMVLHGTHGLVWHSWSCMELTVLHGAHGLAWNSRSCMHGAHGLAWCSWSCMVLMVLLGAHDLAWCSWYTAVSLSLVGTVFHESIIVRNLLANYQHANIRFLDVHVET